MSSMELPRPLPDPKLKNSKLSRSNSQLAGLPKKMSFLRRLGSRATKNTYVKPEERMLPPVGSKGPFGVHYRGLFEENEWDPLPQAGSSPRRFNPMNGHFSLPPEGGLFPKVNLAGPTGGPMYEEGRKVVVVQQHMAATASSQEIYYGANKTSGSGNNNNNSGNDNNNNSGKMAVANNSGSSRSGSEAARDKRYILLFAVTSVI